VGLISASGASFIYAVTTSSIPLINWWVDSCLNTAVLIYVVLYFCGVPRGLPDNI